MIIVKKNCIRIIKELAESNDQTLNERPKEILYFLLFNFPSFESLLLLMDDYEFVENQTKFNTLKNSYMYEENNICMIKRSLASVSDGCCCFLFLFFTKLKLFLRP